MSPHKSSRIYFASQRLWKSDNRGDSWEVISPDLTTNTPRTQTPFFGKKQAWDNPWDVYAMSNYSSITNITESPKKKDYFMLELMMVISMLQKMVEKIGGEFLSLHFPVYRHKHL